MLNRILGRVAAGSVVCALAASGGTAVAVQSQGTDAKAKAPNQAAARIKATNDSLDSVAQLVASAIADEALRDQIQARITKRGTPDKAVTFDALAASSTISDDLTDAYVDTEDASATEAQTAVDQLVESLPPVQVSVQGKSGQSASWKTDAPLVAYVPVGVDDMALTTITAYDADGRAYELDATKEPKQAVLVIGPDETAAHEGTAARARAALTSRAPAPASARLAACYEARLTYVRLLDDHEPWALGMAETNMIAKGTGVYYKDEFPYLEMDGDQIWTNQDLGCAGSDVRVTWWEDDSGNADYILHLGEYSFGISMANDDDIIGGRIISKGKFEGGDEFKTDFTGLWMLTK